LPRHSCSDFLTACDKLPIHQSAYRQFHSTETTLLKVLNDLLQAADRGQVSSLCLLDLTAAFDAVDHELLVLQLQRSFGIRGIALAWFISHLSNRTYCVFHGGVYYHLIYVTCSVPQGSVLGPLLFLLYTAARYGVTLHSFADDNQLYIHFRCSFVCSGFRALRNRHWPLDVSQPTEVEYRQNGADLDWH